MTFSECYATIFIVNFIRQAIDLLNKIKSVLKNKLSRELIVYILAGVATTVVNWLVYFIAKKFLSPTVSNIIAWAISVVFAYAVNSRFVFESKAESFGMEIKMFTEFVFARLTSGVIESLGIFIFVEKLGLNDLVIKLALSVFVIVFNYVVSKLWIFKKKDKEGE